MQQQFVYNTVARKANVKSESRRSEIHFNISFFKFLTFSAAIFSCDQREYFATHVRSIRTVTPLYDDSTTTL